MGLLKRIRARPGSAAPRIERPQPDGPESFRCNICEHSCTTPRQDLSREVVSCPGCGSNPRFRAVVSVLSQELFGEQITLPRFPKRKDIEGVGLSDPACYATPLAGRLNYRNTFFDRRPALDITSAQPHAAGTCDFVIASEVFEHVVPPVETAMHNVLEMLKPEGFLLLTVPFTLGKKTRENFPNLFDYNVVELKSGKVVVNRTEAGELEVFDKPVFHGGPGLTLEMRLFCKDGLMSSLGRSGFSTVKVVSGAPEFGACWPEPYSLPVVARR